jgi:hypothetical protein
VDVLHILSMYVICKITASLSIFSVHPLPYGIHHSDIHRHL